MIGPARLRRWGQALRHSVRLRRNSYSVVDEALTGPAFERARAAIETHFDSNEDAGARLDSLVADFDEVLRGSVLIDIARFYLRAPIVVPMHTTILRRFGPRLRPEYLLPYHQDAYVYPIGWRFLTAWILVRPANTDRCVRLELVPGDPGLLPVVPDSPHGLGADAEGLAKSIAKYGVATPDVRRGGAALFHQYTLHRTAHEAAIEPRISFDCRFVARTPDVMAQLNGGKIPYLVCEGDRVEAVRP